MSPERAAFVAWCEARVGTPYCQPDMSNGYLGKGLENPNEPTALDCSGMVTCGLYVVTSAAGRPVDWRHYHNAHRLWMELPPVPDGERLLPGDVACYGTRRHCEHVMVLASDGVRVVGASGGGRKTRSIEAAKAIGACVKFQPNHLYRNDFLGWRRLPLP